MSASASDDESPRAGLVQQGLSPAWNDDRAAQAERIGFEDDGLRPEKKRKLLQHSSMRLAGTALSLSLVWLEPRDLVSCCQVCKPWSNDANDSNAWYQVTKSCEPELVHVLGQSPAASAIDYKTVVMGLLSSRQLHMCEERSRSFIREEDVVFFLQVKDKDSKLVVGTLCFDMSSLPISIEENVLDTGKIQIPIPKSATDAADPNNLDSIFARLRFTIRLFRRDTGESVCFCFEEACDNRDYNSSFFWTTSVHVCDMAAHGGDGVERAGNRRLRLCLGCCLTSFQMPPQELTQYTLTWIGVSAFVHPYDFSSVHLCPRENLVAYLDHLIWN